jgi:regulator of replication initiation timing
MKNKHFIYYVIIVLVAIFVNLSFLYWYFDMTKKDLKSKYKNITKENETLKLENKKLEIKLKKYDDILNTN